MAEKDIPLKLDITEEEIPVYETPDREHYCECQKEYINTRRWFKGIDEHREVKEIEMNGELQTFLEKNFRKWYYESFNDDPTKVMIKK